MNEPLVVYAERLRDLLAEARGELEPDEYADLIVLAAYAVSGCFGDVFEERWNA